MKELLGQLGKLDQKQVILALLVSVTVFYLDYAVIIKRQAAALKSKAGPGGKIKERPGYLV